LLSSILLQLCFLQSYYSFVFFNLITALFSSILLQLCYLQSYYSFVIFNLITALLSSIFSYWIFMGLNIQMHLWSYQLYLFDTRCLWFLSIFPCTLVVYRTRFRRNIMLLNYFFLVSSTTHAQRLNQLLSILAIFKLFVLNGLIPYVKHVTNRTRL
jgi:hypothetical protein